MISRATARSLRIQCAGARSHLISRDDPRELIFLDEKNRQQFLSIFNFICSSRKFLKKTFAYFMASA